MARPTVVAWALCGVLAAGGSLTVGGIAAAKVRQGPDTAAAGASPGRPAPLPGEQTALPAAVNHGAAGATITDAELTALVTARSKALRSHDRQGFLAVIDGLQTAVVTQQGQLFDNLQKIHFTSEDYTVRSGNGAESTFATQAKATVDVDFEHRISGVDAAPVAERYRWTVQRSGPGGALRIVSVIGSPAASRGESYYPAPWDVVPNLTVISRDHLVLMADDTSTSYASGIASQAEDAASFDLSHWSGPSGTAPGFEVFLTSNRSLYGKLYASGDNRTWDVGVTFPVLGAGTGGGYASSRIVLDTTGDKNGSQDVGITLRHEMTHAMVFPFENTTGGGQDHIWVDEGFAEWMGYRIYGDSLVLQAIAHSGQSLGTPSHLPANNEVYAAESATAQKNYTLSQLAVMYMASKYGADKVDRFVVSVYKNADSATGVDDAMRDVLGTTTAQFVQGWAAYVRSNV